jgi:hypothetical protein
MLKKYTFVPALPQNKGEAVVLAKSVYSAMRMLVSKHSKYYFYESLETLEDQTKTSRLQNPKPLWGNKWYCISVEQGSNTVKAKILSFKSRFDRKSVNDALQKEEKVTVVYGGLHENANGNLEYYDDTNNEWMEIL